MTSDANYLPLSLRRNFSWTLAGNAVYLLCQWLIIPVIAKLGTQSQVGQYTIGMAVAMPIMMFTNLQLRNLLATDARRQYRFGDYLGLSLTAVGIGLLLLPMIGWLSGYRTEVILVICAVGLARAFEAISDVAFGLFQRSERLDRVAFALMLKGPIAIGFFVLVFFLSRDVLISVITVAVTRLLGFIVIELPIARSILGWLAAQPGELRERLAPHWKLETIRSLFALALPMGFVTLLIQLQHNLPRYFLEKLYGEATLGVFGAIASFLMAGMLLAMALGQSASPRLSQYFAQQNYSAFCSLLYKLLGIGLLIGLAGLIVSLTAGRWLLTLVFEASYAEHVAILHWIMGVVIMQNVGLFLGSAATAMRSLKPQFPLHILRVLLTLVLCIILIPGYEMVGAAISLLVGAAFSVLAYAGLVFILLRRAAAASSTSA